HTRFSRDWSSDVCSSDLFINTIVTIAKVVPIVVFVLLCLFVFDASAFAENWQGADYAGSLFDQVRGTMLVTVFVFLGVEGASVRSEERRVGKEGGEWKSG